MKGADPGTSRATRITAQLVFGLLALSGLAYNFLLSSLAVERFHGNDFGKFYYATQQWFTGNSLYSPTVASLMEVTASHWIQFADLNPPHFHLLILPFVVLPLDVAAYLWNGLNVWAAIFAGLLTCSELQIQIRRDQVLPLAAAILTCGATEAAAATGQYTGVLLLGTSLAWRASRHSQPVRSGTMIGLLMSLKPFLGLFVLVHLIRREFVAAAAALTTMIAAFVVGVTVFGLQEHQDWLSALATAQWTWAAMNGSWQAVAARLFDLSPYYSPLVVAPGLVWPIWLIGCVIVATMMFFVARRGVDHAYAGTILGALLISPLGWVYYHWLALPPCLALWKTRVPGLAKIGLACLATPLFALLFFQPNPLATLSLGSIYTWATVLLFLAVVKTPSSPCGRRRARHSNHAGTSRPTSWIGKTGL